MDSRETGRVPADQRFEHLLIQAADRERGGLGVLFNPFQIGERRPSAADLALKDVQPPGPRRLVVSAEFLERHAAKRPASSTAPAAR